MQKLVTCPRPLYNAVALPWKSWFLVFSVSNIVFSCNMCWLWKEPGFLVLRRGRRLGHGQTLNADARSGNHWQPSRREVFGEVCHHTVAMVLWQLFPAQTVCKATSTHQSSWVLAGVHGTFPAWCPKCDNPVGSNLESLGPLILFHQSRPHITRDNNDQNAEN